MRWYSYSTCSQCSLVGHENPSVLLAIKKNVKEKKKINAEEKSLHHVDKVAKFRDLNSLWPCKHGRKNDKNDMHDFPVHNCTQEQNSSPFFHHLTMQMAVSAKKDCWDSELLLPW